jgi:hypothetical protein
VSRTVVVSVTQEDIAEGRAGNCVECPIARAAQRSGLEGARLYYAQNWPDRTLRGVLRFRDGGVPREAPVPDEASAFMRDYDAGPEQRHGCQPFTFTLELPDE